MRSLKLLSIATIMINGLAASGAETPIDAKLYTELVGVPEQVQQLQAEMLKQRETNNLEEAIATAESIIDELQEGPDDQLANALLNIATLHLESGDLSSTTASLLRAITVIEDVGGDYAPKLTQALYSLGSIQRVTGSYKDAESSLRRAQHIVHRHDGVYSVGQLEILDQLTLINISQGGIVEADREQEFSYRINEREFGAGDPAMIPAIGKHARFLAKVGRFQYAIGRYQQAIQIVEQHYGHNDIRSIEHWQGIARVRLDQKEFINYGPTVNLSAYRKSNSSSASYLPAREDYADNRVKLQEAEFALGQVADIIISQEGSDITDQIRALVHLGDIYTISGNEEAMVHYGAAIELMKDRLDMANLNSELFGFPTRIFPRKNFSFMVDAYDVPEQPFFADVEFEVTDRGKPTRIEVVESNVPLQEKKLLKKVIYLYRYRPRMINGEFTNSDMNIHQLYRVRLKERPKTSTSSGK